MESAPSPSPSGSTAGQAAAVERENAKTTGGGSGGGGGGAGGAGGAGAGAGAGRQRSEIQPYGYQQKSKCGYCQGGLGSVSYGIGSDRMLVDDYERLMLTGWRRCGTYFYKPCMHFTCCPMFTIRLKAEDFKASKAQRQLVRRMERYLATGDIHMAPAPASAKESVDADVSVVPKNYTLMTERASCTAEKFQLYKKYQITVHGDQPSELTEDGFSRFLVESPLVSDVGQAVSAGSVVQGTHHMLHRIDGQLVAVGVVDLLPSGLSSVYLFYDPDFKHLALGKYTALREIQYCLETGLQYYYMGFYVQDCEKMRYKADYCPSELLCPTTLSWQNFSSVSKAMREDYDAGYAYVPLEPGARAQRLQVGLLSEDAAIRQGKFERGMIKDGKDATAMVGGKRQPVYSSSSEGWKDGKNALNAFAPRFATLPPNFGIEKLPIMLHGQTITVNDVMHQYQKSLRDILKDLLANVDTRTAWRMDIRIA